MTVNSWPWIVKAWCTLLLFFWQDLILQFRLIFWFIRLQVSKRNIHKDNSQYNLRYINLCFIHLIAAIIIINMVVQVIVKITSVQNKAFLKEEREHQLEPEFLVIINWGIRNFKLVQDFNQQRNIEKKSNHIEQEAGIRQRRIKLIQIRHPNFVVFRFALELHDIWFHLVILLCALCKDSKNSHVKRQIKTRCHYKA